MHTKNEQLVENDHNFSLFFTLPNQAIVCLRQLHRHVTFSDLRARLELQAGLPSHTYRILLPGGRAVLPHELTKSVRFGKELKNGAILKVLMDPQYQSLFDVVVGNQCEPDDVYRAIVSRGRDGREDEEEGGEGEGSGEGSGEEDGGEGEEREMSNADRSLVLLFLACYHGNHEICKILLHFDPEVPGRLSEFGRTAFHVAAANDQVQVTHLLLSKLEDFSPRDIFGKTPLEYCRVHGAFTCERLIRFKVLTLAKKQDKDNNSIGNASRKRLKSKKRSSQSKTLDHSNAGNSLLNNDSERLQGLHEEVQDGVQDMTMEDIKDIKDSQGGCKLNVSVNNTLRSSGKDLALSLRERCHSECYKRPAFVALCKIPLEEQRLVTVEFKPLDRPKSGQSTARVKFKPQIQKGNSAREEAVERADGKVVQFEGSQAVKRRTKSAPAQYYRTKYHKTEEDVSYKERPSTATTRFRFWKTWLIDKDTQQLKTKTPENQSPAKHQENMAAFKRWLAEKEREERRRKRRQESEEESESSDSEEENSRAHSSNWPTPREQAFKDWLERKRTMIVQLAHKKRLAEAKAKEATGRIDIYDRKLTCFEIGCTDPGPLRHPSVDNYIRDYRTWHAKREKFEAWKSKNDIETGGAVTEHDLQESKRTFHRDGMTYEEWLGMKHRTAKLAKAKMNAQN